MLIINLERGMGMDRDGKDGRVVLSRAAIPCSITPIGLGPVEKSNIDL